MSPCPENEVRTLGVANARGSFGPTHDNLTETVQRRLQNGSYIGSANTVRAYLRESIVAPAAYLVLEYARSRFLMPAYTDLTPGEISALVALLALQ